MDTVVLHVLVQFERLASKRASCRGTSVALDTLRSRGVQREVNRRARAAAVFALAGCWHPLSNILALASRMDDACLPSFTMRMRL